MTEATAEPTSHSAEPAPAPVAVPRREAAHTVESSPFALNTTDEIWKAMENLNAEAFRTPERGGRKRNVASLIAGVATGVLTRDVATFLTKHALPPFVSAFASGAARTIFDYAGRLKIFGGDRYSRYIVRQIGQRGGELATAKGELLNPGKIIGDMMKYVDTEGNLDQELLKSATGRLDKSYKEKYIIASTVKGAAIKAAFENKIALTDTEQKQFNRIAKSANIAQHFLSSMSAEDQMDFMLNRFEPGVKREEELSFARTVGKGAIKTGVRAIPFAFAADVLTSHMAQEIYSKAGEVIGATGNNLPGWIQGARDFINARLTEGGAGVVNWWNNVARPGIDAGINWIKGGNLQFAVGQ